MSQCPCATFAMVRRIRTGGMTTTRYQRTSARCSRFCRRASHARAVAFLVALSLVAFLPGFFNVPPIDRDEARFAQATKQMIESGDYVDIRYQDEVRYKKPVGIYWLQAGVGENRRNARRPAGPHTIWLYRIPSLIGAIGAVLLTYWAALAFVSRRMALSRRPDAGELGPARRRGAPRQDRRRAAACCVAAMAVMARAYLTQSTGRDIGWGHAGDPLDRARGRHPAQRPADPDGGGARGRLGEHRGPLGALAAARCGRWSACSGS